LIGHPEVEVLLSPSPVFPGQSLVVSARFAAKGKRRTRGVSLSLVGFERYVDEAAQRHTFLSLAASFDKPDLTGEGGILRARFEIPPNAPPTVTGRVVQVQYELTLNVDLAWWPDLDREYTVPVARPMVDGAIEQTVFVSNRDARGRGLYAEVTLPTRCISPGHVLHGAVSFTNVGALGRQRPTLAFVCRESRLQGTGHPTNEYTFDLGDVPSEDGVAIPFRVRFPASGPRSFEGFLGRLRWTLEVRVGARGAAIMAIPIEVGDFRDATSASLSVAIGRTRRAAVWRDASQAFGMRFDDADARLSADVGCVRVEITSETLADAGPSLVATLRYPRIGLEIDVRKRSIRDLLVWGETKTGDDTFDGALHAAGRDPTIVRALLQQDVRARLLDCGGVRVEDARTSFHFPGAGLDRALLDSVLRLALDLARALDGSIARLPFPEDLEEEAHALRELAASYEGRFVPAAMTVDEGTLRGIPIELGFLLEPPSTPTGLYVRARATSADRLAEVAETPRGRAILAELHKCGTTRLGDAVEVELPSVAPGVRALGPIVENAVALVELAERGAAVGPYR